MITATIFCFIIVDRLGGVGFNASTVPIPEKDEGLGSLNALQLELPVKDGTKLAFKTAAGILSVIFYSLTAAREN